jgi:alkylation response protein AidB-like acyl-CoA dehydrogenase
LKIKELLATPNGTAISLFKKEASVNFDLTEEQVMARKMAHDFAEKEMLPTLRAFERRHEVNMGLIKKMASLGLLAVHLPQQYGGMEAGYVTAALVWEQLSQASWTQTLISLGHAVLAGTILSKVASEEQKRKYLPPLCKGDLIVAMAAVEPNVGSDASAVEAKATLDGDTWVINGSKNFITAGSLADVVLVLVQTNKELGPKGLALIALEKDVPGFRATPADMVGGRAGEISTLSFTDCRVPKSNVVGEIGRGLQNALVGIDTARLFVSSGAIGMAQSCLDSCIKYAKERIQFKKPIGSFQLVQETVARMYAEIQTTRWQVYYAADLKNKGVPHAKELSAAKWLSSELAVRVSAEAIRLHGAYGCSDEYPVEHHYRDAIMSTILGGTSEMHKLTIGSDLLGLNALR